MNKTLGTTASTLIYDEYYPFKTALSFVWSKESPITSERLAGIPFCLNTKKTLFFKLSQIPLLYQAGHIVSKPTPKDL